MTAASLAEPTRTDPLAFQARGAEAFAEDMLSLLNSGALALAISLGHRAGLFDVLASLPPVTPADLAGEAGLQEPYVREWLGAMIAGGIVEIDAETGRVWLPAEHAAVLTRTAAQAVGACAQWIPLLAGAEDAVLGCMEQGGGLPADAYPRLGAVLAEPCDRQLAERLRREVLPAVPGLPAALERGLSVLVVGGERESRKLAAAFPRSHFVGVESLPPPPGPEGADPERVDRFDLVISLDPIHGVADSAPEVLRSRLRAGGVLIVQRLRGSGRLEEAGAHPLGALLYAISCQLSTPVALAEGRPAGLGWDDEASPCEIEAAGFRDVRPLQIDDPLFSFCCARASD